jgi:hypothetical protein
VLVNLLENFFVGQKERLVAAPSPWVRTLILCRSTNQMFRRHFQLADDAEWRVFDMRKR